MDATLLALPDYNTVRSCVCITISVPRTTDSVF